MKHVYHRCFTVAFALTVILSFAVASGAETVSVNYSPQVVQFSHNGNHNGTQGSRSTNVTVSRQDPGLLCNRVNSITVYVDAPDSSFPADHRLFSKKVGTGGLCSFNETIEAELVAESMADQACASGKAGKTNTLNRTVKVVLYFNNGNTQTVDQRTLQAQIRCDCMRLETNTAGDGYLIAYTGLNNTKRLFRTISGHAPFSVQAVGPLPQGMNLEAGQNPSYPSLPHHQIVYLKGQPTTEGDYSFTVRITDACPHGSQTIQRPITLLVRCVKFEFPANMQLPQASTGAPYSYQLQTSCSTAYTPQQFSGRNLPPGLNLSPTGLLSGTPITSGNYDVFVQSYSASPPVGHISPASAGKSLPVQVRDTAPPQVVSYTVTPRSFLTNQGGQVTVSVRATDGSGVQIVNAYLISPSGQETSSVIPRVSGTATNGEWRTALTIPANNNPTSVQYGIKAVLSDTGNTSTTTQVLTVTVGPKQGLTGAATGTKTSVQLKAPITQTPNVPPVSQKSMPKTQAPKTPAGSIR